MNQNEMNKRGAAIARILGAIYTAPTGEVWIARGDLTMPCGATFDLRLNERDNRIVVSANWPRGDKGIIYYPSSYDKSDYKWITVDASKSPERIAKDIQTRFLPAFLPEFARQAAKKQASLDYANQGKAGIARLAKAYGVLPPGGDVQTFSLSLGGYYGSATTYGTNAQIELRGLTIEQAEQVLKLVATFSK